MKKNRYLVLLFLLVWCCSSCGNFPKDPENTLENVTNGTLLVGYSENPPWVVASDSVPTGIEPELIKAFATTINAKVAWQNDTEQNLFEDLEKKKIHLVIAGITKSNPWKKKVGLTRVYVQQGKKKHVIAAIRGENAFIVHLERFLYEREQQLKKRVQHEEVK
ncbi:transporter substrate-binding domain-containing protein [Botryobacter ruber]|uniref:transporter substrate-binding domain-containing protein n=1 Tax=Botryobacter ruber TaxID=2171629 RepID=UPI000E0C4311|nr:transporter substrate-binding domain-containing protein [Botryobacter ruber]